MIKDIKTKLNEKERTHRFQDVELFPYRLRLYRTSELLYLFVLVGGIIATTVLILITPKIEETGEFVEGSSYIVFPVLLAFGIAGAIWLFRRFFFWKHPRFIELEYTEKIIDSE